MKMDIFHKVALQNLRNNHTRTLVTIMGVVLSAAMFTGIATFGTSLIQYLINVEVANGGEWHVVFSDADASFVQERMEDRETDGVFAYENIGYALLEGAKEESAKKPYLFFVGFGDEALEELPIHLTAGRMPENSQEILIPSHIAIKAGVKIPIGETLTLETGEREYEGRILSQCDPYMEGERLVTDRERTYTVTGLYERPDFELHEAPGYTVVTRQADREATGHYSVFLRLLHPRKVRAYAEDQEGGGSWAVNESLLRFMGISENRLFKMFLYTIGGVLVVIIMTASVFLIYNSFHISLNERVHQFGILMSVGATARQLRGMVLFEGLCIGGMGIPFGILAGIGCIRLILPVVSDKFASVTSSSVPLGLSVSGTALLASAAVSMVTILISAWIPAQKAASVPVLECIRQTGEIRTDGKAVRTPKLVWRFYGLEGALALKNFKRNKRRYRGVILSLTFSVVLAVTGNAFDTTLKRTTGRLLTETADGDISFITEDMQEEEFIRLYDRLKETEGVYRSTWQADAVYQAVTEELPDEFLEKYRKAMGDDSTGSAQQVPLYTQFIEDSIYYEYIDRLGLSREEFTGPDAKVLMCAADMIGHVTYYAGSSMDFTLASSSEEQEKAIEVYFSDNYPLDMTFEEIPDWAFVMTVPMQMKSRFDDVETTGSKMQHGMLFWSDAPSKALAGIQEQIVEQGIYADYMLYNLSMAFELYRNLGFVVDIFMYVFVFMIVLIAVANVFNTISTNIRLRRRELAMLRSVGMSERSFNRMMSFECMFYGMRTLLYSIPLSGLLSWLIHRAFMAIEKIDEFAFVFPWGALTVSVLGVFGIVFITMVYATSRIRRENIIDSLRDEMA